MIHSSHQQELYPALRILGLLFLVALIILLIPMPAFFRGASDYLALHMVLEAPAIIIAILIFSLTWHTPHAHATRSLIVLGTAFLGVGIIDFSHTLSYPGMPDYVTPSGSDKTLTLWLAARLLAALALLYVAATGWRVAISPMSAKALLLGVLLAVALLHVLVFFFPQTLPRTFIEGQGLTPFKINAEYVLIGLYLLAGALLLLRMRRQRTFNASDLLVAVITMALAEFFFTLYADFADLYNVTGHIFKVVAYVFLYRGIVLAALRQPYARIEQLSDMVEQTPNPIIVTDTNARIEYVNQEFVKSTGYTAEEVIGLNPRILNSGKTPRENYRAMWTNLLQGLPWRGEFINKRKNGEEYLEQALIFPVRDDNQLITHYIAHKEDISAKRAAEERIRHLSFFDQLTGLPNRLLLEERFQFLREDALDQDQKMVLMWIDLDNFKDVNDSLGHVVGDRMLVDIAERLQNCMTVTDTVARISGDDFIVLIPDADVAAATVRVEQIKNTLGESLHVDGHDILPTASIGLALFPADGEFFEILLSGAESAMYQVKASGRNNYCFFTAEMQQKSSRLLLLSNAIKLAITNNELRLVFQPQMALSDGSLVGAEALLRWHHSEVGDVRPDEFIPLAESAGLMVQLGEWVLNKVASQLQQWRMSGHPVIKIAVNFASVMFARIETVDDLRAVLHAYDLPPTLLELEMTESAAIQNPLETLQTMRQLTAMGLHLAIDDFGTGYSSLSYLRHLSVHKLKIDQSFMRELHTNKDGQAIVTAIIRMAQELGMKVLAEGVETGEQLEFLRAKGCDEIQGYFYSKPLELDDFADFLLRHRA